MRVILSTNRETSANMQRDAYANTIAAILDENPNVAVLDADLAACVNMTKIMRDRPRQSFNVGIAEANMVCIAAGLASTGKIPFAHTFACFASRRACDQVFMAACYAHSNIRLIGSDPGIGASFNGGTHMPFTDMGILRTMPNITLLEPTDHTMTADLIRQLVDLHGIYYIRLYRKASRNIYEPGSTFDIGKAVTLREGKDVTIISSGLMVSEALDAADILQKEGISASVLDMFTWKPIDEQAILSAADETGCIVTAENHSVAGGLGSAVAEFVCKTKTVPIEMIGVQDLFGEVGSEDWLKERFNLSASDIVAASKRAIGRKGDI